jgi:hypothetical protein
MSKEIKPPIRVSVDNEGGLVKQATFSAFSPKSRVKYLNTLLPFSTIIPSSNPPSVINSGIKPPIPDLLYVAEGYVENGYV